MGITGFTSIADRVRGIIATELCVPNAEVTDDARLGEQLEADSMDRIHLTMALEEAFGLDIPDADAEDLVRVGDVVAYITQRCATLPAA